MGKGIFVVVILGILVVGTIAGLYFWYEKPVQIEEAISYVNLSITASDEITKEPLEAEYSILLEGNTDPFRTGKTFKEGFILDYVEGNTTYKVSAVAPGYYSTSLERFATPNSGIQRTDLLLERIGNLTVTQQGQLRQDSSVTLTAIANGTVKNLHFCTAWSAKIITLNPIGNFTQIEPFPVYADQYDKCYSTNATLRNSNLSVPFEYRKFGDLESEDFIKVILLDADELYSSTAPTAFQGDTDIGMTNLVYEFK